MTHADHQAQMPQGLHLEHELPSDPGFGPVFEAMDHRHAVPVRRVVRLVRMTEPQTGADGAAPAQVEFHRRLERLVRQNLPHVSTPREIVPAADGGLYLVGDHDGDSLQSRIPAVPGLPVEDVEAWLHQILTGLAALHAEHLAHGDLRPGNLFIGHGESQTARIADAAVGPMTHWTNGQRLHPAAPRYYPPEWQGSAGQPSPKADLYALGVTVCEMLLGRNAVTDLLADGNRLPWSRTRKKLQALRIPGPLISLLRRLLAAKPNKRPADAGETAALWASLEHRRERRRLLVPVAGALMIMLLLSLAGWTAASNKSRALEQDVTEARNELRQVKRELADLKTQVATADRAILALEQQAATDRETIRKLRGEPPDPVLAAAMRFWREHQQSLNDLPAKVKQSNLDPDVQQLLLRWYNRMRPLRANAPRWFATEPEMQRDHDAACQTPWDDQIVTAAEHHLRALNEAEERWRSWAGNMNLSWANFEKLIDDPSIPPGAQEALKRWQLAMLARSTKLWRLRVTAGTAPAGWGTGRMPGVLGSGDWVYDDVHNWGSETAHVYAPQPRVLEFTWQPGDALSVCMYGERRPLKGGGRSLLLNTKPFRGPLAIWRAHDRGRVEAGGFSLAFEIEDCPGPPRKAALIPQVR